MAGILPDERRRNYLSRAIGALGEIQFECSSELVRTFKDYKRESKARYATHNLLMKKPALEYLGADAGEISSFASTRDRTPCSPSAITASSRRGAARRPSG